jgi:hypothetical protein
MAGQVGTRLTAARLSVIAHVLLIGQPTQNAGPLD